MISGDAQPAAKAVFTSASGFQPWDNIKWKAVLFQGYRLVMDLHRGKTGLFRIQDDPYEQNSLAEEEPERVAALKKLLDTFSETNARHPLRQETVDKFETPKDLLEALRAVGYVK